MYEIELIREEIKMLVEALIVAYAYAKDFSRPTEGYEELMARLDQLEEEIT